MTTQIDPLLDIQTKVLRATFVNNMAVLKKYMPDVFKFYQDYTPTRVKLIFDDNGHLNLVSNGSLIYEDDPKKLSDQQVAEFLKTPRHVSYQIAKDGVGVFEHENILRRMVEKRESEVGTKSKYQLTENEQIDFIAFMGTGLGYHLESLFARHAIRFAFVYEPDPDCFYCTLHNVDFGEMIKSCFAQGGQLTLQIGGNATGFVNEISRIFTRQGYFNISRMYLYRHYLSDKTDEAFKMVHDLAHRYVSGWGFFEDEITGISHTLLNIGKYLYPSILKSAKEIKRELPVFIMGNGPSLDDSIEFLRTNQDKAIIVSSGTSLKPLLDNGIIPDIHVESERAVRLFKWIDNTGHKEKIKKINLICLNTVYPEISKLFKKAHIILKPKDAAATFVKNFISEKYTEVMYCNPTVTNASTSALVSMGFKNLFLFGVDYGYKSEEYHHSKDSLHFQKGSIHYKDKVKGAFQVKGNFVDKVFTGNVFDSSRMTLEMLLNANRDVNCTNCSDGAAIQLTKACRVNELPALVKLPDKAIFIEQLLSDSFDNSEYVKKDLMAEFELLLPQFNVYVGKLKQFTQKVITRTELANAFSEQHKYVKDQTQKNRSKELFERFMTGTLTYMQANIMSNSYYYIDQQEQHEYIQFCIRILNEHFDYLLKELKEKYNKPAKF